jgi:hypothetical protein
MDPDPDYLYELNPDPNQQHCQKLVSKGKDRNIQERAHRITDDTCTITVSVIIISEVLILTMNKYTVNCKVASYDPAPPPPTTLIIM